MGRLAWYKRDPRAALDDTLHLSLEEAGAYSKVLDLLFMMDGRLPDDPAFIMRWLNCDGRVWKRIRQQLIDKGKLYVEDRYLLSYAVATYLATHLAKPQLGDSETPVSGKNNDLDAPRARVLEKKNKKENLEPLTPETPTLPISEPELPLEPSAPAIPASKPKAQKPPYPPEFDRLWQAYPLRKQDRDAKVDVFNRWKTETKGQDHEAIIAAAQAFARSDGQNEYRIGLKAWLRNRAWLTTPATTAASARASPPIDPKLAFRLAEAKARNDAILSAEAAGLDPLDEKYDRHVGALMMEWYNNEQRRSA